MDKYRTIAEAILVLGLVIVGGVALEIDKAYYCESRSIVLNCDRTTATRCYYDDTYKVCKEGWKPLKDIVEISDDINSVKVSANGGSYNCQTEDGSVSSYTRCLKENGQTAYLGEIV